MSLFLKLSPKPNTVFELKVALEKIWDIFSQIQLTKLSPALETGSDSTHRLVEHILSIHYNSCKC